MVSFLSWLNGRDEATKNKSDDTRRAEDENVTWEQDRAGFGGEWSGLVGEWGGDFAPPAVVEQDGFPAMTHQQIYDALEGVSAALINDKAAAWRGLAEEARTANKEFLDGVNADLEAGWHGESGRAAVAGVRAFSASFDSLAASFQMVAHGLDLMEGHLAHAKASVGKPDSVTVGDKIANALPLDDLFKSPQYRADEAQETARWVMTTYYEPGAGDVDSKTPILPEPKKTVDDGGQPDNGRPPGHNGTGTGDNGTGGDSGTGSGTETETGDEANPEDQGQPGEPEAPQGTEPPGTAPQATEPQSAPAPTTPQSTTPTTPSLSTGAPNTPGMPSGSPSGAPPGGPQGGPPPPGQSVPGLPGAGPAGAPAAAAPAAATGAGRGGAPGMMPGGARGGGGKDDEDEHTTPDYLVYDRGSELLGTQPPALPPGGVIGA